MEKLGFKVAKNKAGKRLDVFLEEESRFSRSFAQKLISSGNLKVDGTIVSKAAKILKGGENLELTLPAPEKLEVKAEAIPLEIIYQDPCLLVVNKPRGMVVHPGAGRKSGTLVNALLYHCKDLSGIGGFERPGIVHRLDKDTSGIMLVAKEDQTHRELSRQFAQREIKKEYLALVYGFPGEQKFLISEPLVRNRAKRKLFKVMPGSGGGGGGGEGRAAETEVRLERKFKEFSLLRLLPRTGRTHQLRVHLAARGFPIVGDLSYSRRKNPFNLEGQFLHAEKIGFFHPGLNKTLSFSAPLPPELLRILTELE